MSLSLTMPSEFSNLLKEAILRHIVEEDRLLRKVWVLQEPRPRVRYEYNLHETFGVSQEEACRDIRILIDALRRISREKRPDLEIWVHERDPTVPYTDTLAYIFLKVEDEALLGRAEIGLRLPSPVAIRRFERLLRRLGVQGKIRMRRIEELMANLTENSINETSTRIKIRKHEFLRSKRKLIAVVDIEAEPEGHSIASQLIHLVRKARSACKTFYDILALSARLGA